MSQRSQNRNCAYFFVVIFCLLFLMGVPFQAFSKAKEHNHGVADLNIAADGKKIVLEFESPADSIYGFEHAPKTSADKNKQAEGLKRLKENFSSLVSFDALLKCSVQTESVEVKQESAKHSEVKAKFEYICDKAVAGAKLRIDFTKHFPALAKIRVQVISGEKQHGMQINQKGEIPL